MFAFHVGVTVGESGSTAVSMVQNSNVLFVACTGMCPRALQVGMTVGESGSTAVSVVQNYNVLFVVCTGMCPRALQVSLQPLPWYLRQV